MSFQRTLWAGASVSALAAALPLPAFAQATAPASPAAPASTAAPAPAGQGFSPETVLPPVVVRALPFSTGEAGQILAPARVLSGDELRRRLGTSLGDSLSGELGVATSAFGTGASRPIIRGLDGPRVKVLSNGMSVADVSSLSADHAVGVDEFTARQVEILRGPAALLYGSGAIGGLVNVVNDRIPTRLEPQPTGEAEVRRGSADESTAGAVSVDGSAGSVGLHVDGSVLDAHDPRIPGPHALGEADAGDTHLPWAYSRRKDVGVGASWVGAGGYLGASVGRLAHRYGVPSEEGAQIDLRQTRWDLDGLLRSPVAGVESVRARVGHTSYLHTELDLAGEPEGDFRQRALETRWELTHAPLGGWRGTVGVHTERSRFEALSAEDGEPDTVPRTRSSSSAVFVVEELAFGPVRLNAGARIETVRRRPEVGESRAFDLGSWSVGGLWAFTVGHEVGVTLSQAQRAPSTEELYANGPHHATETFDVGNAALRKETSHNVELTVQKTAGPLRWKANLFHNRVRDFIHGQLTGNLLDDEGQPGDELHERLFSQADATIRGAEAEVSWNQRGEGASWRAFADTSRGRLEGAGSLPLQPATRLGAEVGWRQGPWRTGASVIHARRQDRLAAQETPTPSWTRLDAHLSWTQRLDGQELTWFLLARNLLDEDIRLSTSLLKDTAPLPGRQWLVGLRTRF